MLPAHERLAYTFLLYLGCLGGAMVLGKTSSAGASYNFDDSRARTYCVCSRCKWGFFWTFLLSSILSFLCLPVFGRQPDIDWNTVSKCRETQNNQPTNPSLLSPRTTKLWRDIGSVPYVCMCVRTYVRSFVRMFTFCHRSSDLIYYPISI